MQISTLGRSISASPTLQLNQRAAALKARGVDVIHLGGGEPLSLAPEAATAAGVALLNTRAVRYTPAAGTTALRQAIADYTARFYGITPTPSHVIASNGAKQSLMIALRALVDPGDEVIFLSPYWVSYPEMVRLCGATPVVVETDADFQPRLEDITAAITPKTRVIMLNSPNNPTGVVYSAALLRGVIAACEARGVWLIMDDIYQRLVFDEAAPSGFALTERGLDEGVIIAVNGVSKQYAMTGFRLGWAVGPKVVISAMADIQSHETSGPSTVAQEATAAALAGDQAGVEALRLELRAHRDLLVNGLAQIEGARVIVPDGTFYLFADFSAIEPDDRALAERLLEQQRVVVVPGVDFGRPGHLRLSYCRGRAELEEAVGRLQAFFARG
ncbi:pyridoxal phosphate-dependent aminotransferase [Myxococcota bacterium]|nr:pyridoxal phosphate-dependent aminotransferase [Myxococcota bacterium]MBU1430940.1 pyridoxal phosphate-dependent aminotransferase [Myxococcota bacterium]MBU1899529.1 pyridoxal phosphate-dependent aminotransferase [Myxococcota bacterium]